MAKYTTQIRTIIQNQSDDFQLFGFTYPIFDEAYRPVLEAKIINRFFFREIGFETVGMFQHYLMTKMNEIMPYYNQLYQSQLIEVDPLVTHKFNDVQTRNTTGNAQAQSNSSGSSNEVYSDTPQGKLTIPQGYATSVTDTLSGSEGTSAQTVTNTDEYIRNLSGNQSGKSESELIMMYRNAIINVDEMILDRLNDLFMQIY